MGRCGSSGPYRKRNGCGDPHAAYRYNTLGVAQYRAGNWQAAIEALMSCDHDAVAPSTRIANLLYLAMSHAKSGGQVAAQRVLDEAMEQIDAQQEVDEDISGLLTEARELLGREGERAARNDLSSTK